MTTASEEWKQQQQQQENDNEKLIGATPCLGKLSTGMVAKST